MMEMSPDIVYGGSFVLHCSGNKPHIRKFGPLWLCSKGLDFCMHFTPLDAFRSLKAMKDDYDGI